MKKGVDKNQRVKDNWLINIIFWLHLPLIIIWFGAFFIPLSFWPKRIIFHFWFIAIILIIQLIWGIILYPKTKKINFICPLTTLMQSLRGYKIKDKENYNHSFIAELLKKLKINASFFLVNVILIITFLIALWQYVGG